MTVPIFELRDVTYRYEEIDALSNLNLTILAGRRIALLGANGSGKSTLLSILDGLYFPPKGSVMYCGEPLTEDRLQTQEIEFDFRRKVALVFQNPDIQLFNPTVFDEIAFGPLQVAWPKDQILTRVSEILERMEIVHLKDPRLITCRRARRNGCVGVSPDTRPGRTSTGRTDSSSRPKEREPDD